MVLRVLIVGIITLLSSGSSYEQHKKKIEKVLYKLWEDTPYTVKTIDQAHDLHGTYYQLMTNDSTMAYMVVDTAPGKIDDFTYMVIFNQNATIRNVTVLQYRENYGGEIASKRFLKQYIGKLNGSQMEYLSDIDGISGATISVRSINRGVKRNSQELYNYLKVNK